MLFEFRRKILAVIIGKTENFYTIESIEPSLNPHMFFKATRGCIISIGSIAKVSKYFNSRLKVSLKHNASMDLMISRARVQDFLKWLDG
ncbi:LytTR family transcriptional regulator DNA-binding domain-containing protein [uncultured Rikenella sp.]|uniref:LytTR family transcriptional regulator DNA-binding domain-containing protein n=1 Tax=uncultured Rikenella sp. TaxID=368003 RepID=UPI002622A83E|nr:LytTR family transcriptional regulator DNA-binding domain-containing protein [uncultured Rikenella sp.]